MSLAGKLPRWFILSSIAVIGLVLIGIQIFINPSQWEIIPRDIGIALLVAPILAFTIDRWTKNELREDAVKATLHAIIRPEFHGELQRIFSYEFLCERHRMNISILSLDNEQVRITLTVERRLCNILAD
jgi:hypothetical protein